MNEQPTIETLQATIARLEAMLDRALEQGFDDIARANQMEKALQALQDGWVKGEIPASAWAMCRAALSQGKAEGV